MRKLIYFICILFSVPFFMACPSETEEFPIDFGYEYYPMQQGLFWEYQVDSVIYTELGNKIDSTRSFVREEIVEKFVDQAADTVFRVERSFGVESGDFTRVIDQWATSVDETKVTRTEENLKYIKMVFPVEVEQRWDGNAFLNENTIITVRGETLELFIDWDYEVLSYQEEEEIGGLTYSDVFTIQSADNFDPDLEPSEQNKLERRFVIEKYAKDVGLVYKKHMILDTQCLTIECETQPWEEKAEKGYIMEMILFNYGK